MATVYTALIDKKLLFIKSRSVVHLFLTLTAAFQMWDKSREWREVRGFQRGSYPRGGNQGGKLPELRFRACEAKLPLPPRVRVSVKEFCLFSSNGANTSSTQHLAVLDYLPAQHVGRQEGGDKYVCVSVRECL